MKISVVISWVGTGLAVVFASALWNDARQFKTETAELRRELEKVRAATENTDDEPIEMADVMTNLQRHSNKLYFAGKLENWPLAAFYLHEINETVAEIKDKNVMKGHINLSALMVGSIAPDLETLKAIVKVKDREGFLMQYHTLTESCNNCHQATDYPFIVIEEPRTPAIDNQNYAVSSPLAGKVKKF